jgi:hypothetical protein
MDRKRRRRGLERAGGTQPVTEHSLAERHRKALGVWAEDVPQSCRLRSIILRRSSAMCVDVVDVVRIPSRVT